MRLQGVIFDMDGVLVDSESLWHEVRRDFVAGFGGRWTEDDQRAVMGANSAQWAGHIRSNFGVELENQEVIARVVSLLEERLSQNLPLLPGAREAVTRLAAAYPLAVASSSPRRVIEKVLEGAGLGRRFEALVSSDEVERGKPSPDVYLEACRRLAVEPHRAVAIEDSTNGIKAADAAGLSVVALPNPHFPPTREALRLAGSVIETLHELTPQLVEQTADG
jgi:HAD superfamily hydrolase (TIGR01509 family)